MIILKDDEININGKIISFPIRIRQVLEIENFILVSLAYDYNLDVGIEWNKGGKEKWNELHGNFNNSALFCFGKCGNKIWEFPPRIFVNISKIDDEPIENDLRVKSWIQSNPDKPNVFLVYGDDKLLVDYKTGEIYKRLELR
jgi:hypothetical protein